MSHLDRRSLLTLSAAAAVGTALSRASRAEVELVIAGQHAPKLLRVNVAPHLVARKVAGLRPYRPSGFVVKAEPLDDKIVIHNYGHGGCGITLSWGTADMAARLALETEHRNAAVLGCGAVGLTTARLLQDRGFQVSIHAKGLPPNVTSSVAAAMFGLTEIVDSAHHNGPFITELQQAVRFAHLYFQNFVGTHYGVRWLEMYLIGDEPQGLPWEFTITPELFPIQVFGPGEHPFPTQYACSFHTMMIETINYLPALMTDFLMRGGKLHVQEFTDKAALAALDAPLIVNCTGLGAKALFGDTELTPVKGQLTLLLPQAEVNYAYLKGSPTGLLYMFPRSDAIILGGSQEVGVWSTDPDATLAEQILAGHAAISGSMG